MFSRIKALLAVGFLLLITPWLIPLFLLFSHKKHLLRQKVAKLFITLFGFQLIQKGHLDSHADILFLNHLSFLDVIYFEAIYPRDICWIAKKELGKLPLYGQVLIRSDMILIDREDKRGMIALLKACKRAKEAGRVLAIFPEGTRGDGKQLRPFKPGAQKIAEKFQMRIQPIILSGTNIMFDTKSFTADTSTPGSVLFLDAFIPQVSTEWFSELESHMRKVYHDELANHTSHRNRRIHRSGTPSPDGGSQ